MHSGSFPPISSCTRSPDSLLRPSPSGTRRRCGPIPCNRPTTRRPPTAGTKARGTRYRWRRPAMRLGFLEPLQGGVIVPIVVKGHPFLGDSNGPRQGHLFSLVGWRRGSRSAGSPGSSEDNQQDCGSNDGATKHGGPPSQLVGLVRWYHSIPDADAGVSEGVNNAASAEGSA